MEEQKIFYKIIDELCKEKGITQELLSYGWIRKLKKEGKCRNIIGYQFDLNTASSYKIASDKFACYEILNSNNIPMIPHKILFNPKTRSHYYNEEFLKESFELLKKSDNKIVIKANNSYKGKDVYYCSSEKEIEETVLKLFEENNDTLSACPFLDIDYEYRVIYLAGEIFYIYKKIKAYVIGDGKSNLKQLIDEKFIKNKINPDLCKNLDFDYIPNKNEKVTVSWKHNLSGGAEAENVDNTEEGLKTIIEIAKKAGEALNIKFASIDVIKTKDKKIQVMEVNANVCMNKFTELIQNGYDIAKNIYSKALDEMFK